MSRILLLSKGDSSVEIAGSLRSMGHRIVDASTPADAVEIARRTEPDFVVIDSPSGSDFDPAEAANIIEETLGIPVVRLGPARDGRITKRIEKALTAALESALRMKAGQGRTIRIEKPAGRAGAPHDRYGAAYRQSPVAACILDASGSVLDANDCFLLLLGRYAEDVRGVAFSDFLPDGDAERFEGLFKGSAHGVEIRGGRFDLVRRDGMPVAATLYGRGVCGEDGRFDCYHLVATVRGDEEEDGSRAKGRLSEDYTATGLPADHWRGRVLVTEGAEGAREGTSKMLSALGYSSETAADGLEAVILCKKAADAGRPYDLVIIDLSAPGGMGGLEALGKILAIDPAAKVIALSGYPDDPVLGDPRSFGFAAALQKPFLIGGLNQVLSHIRPNR